MRTVGIVAAVAFALLWVNMASALTISGGVMPDADLFVTAESPEEDVTRFAADGRVRVIFTSTVKNDEDFFVSGTGFLRLDLGGYALCGDGFISFGNKTWNVRFGRFKKTNLFERGDYDDDMYIVQAEGAPYRAEGAVVRGISQGGDFAFNYNITDKLMFELGGVFNGGETLAGGKHGETEINAYGIRPVIQYSTPNLLVKFGGEYRPKLARESDSDFHMDTYGLGGTIEFGNEKYAVAVTGGYRGDRMDGYATEEAVDVTKEMVISDVITIGGYAGVDIGKETLWTGVFYTTSDTEFSGVKAKTDQIQVYTCLLHPLPIDRMKIKFNLSYAKGGKDIDVDAYGAQFRVLYNFGQIPFSL